MTMALLNARRGGERRPSTLLTVLVLAFMTMMDSIAGLSTDCSVPTTTYPGAPSNTDIQAALGPAYMELAPSLKTPGCFTSLVSTTGCINEYGVQTGCCDAECTVGLGQISSACAQEFFCLMAAHPVYSGVPYLYSSRLWARCAPNFVAGPDGGICKQTTAANQTDSGINGTVTTPSSAGCPDPNQYPLIASSTGECAVTNDFFDNVTPQVKEKLFFSIGLAHTSCMRSMPNLTTHCATDFFTKSGCCSQECAQTLQAVDPQCAADATARLCASDPRDPSVKAMMNVIKRCKSGQPLVCSASTVATYPLKVWDSCDCPIASKPWSNGYTGLLSIELFNTDAITDYCKKHIVSGITAPCLLDLSFEEGCCSADCWEKLNTVGSRECATQYLAAICKYPGGEAMAHGFHNLLKRCQDSASPPPTCEDLANGAASNAFLNSSSPASASNAAGRMVGAASLLLYCAAAGTLLLSLERLL